MTSILESGLIKAVPKAIKIDQKFESGAISRTSRSFAAKNQIYSYSGNAMVSIPIPSSGWLDMGNSYLHGLHTHTAGAILGRSCHSNIRRAVLLSSAGQVLFDVEGYNVLESAIADLTVNPQQRDSSFALLSCTGDDARRTAIAAGINFSFQPLLEIMRTTKILPFHMIGECTLNLYLDDPRTVYSAASGTVTSSWQNVKLVADVVTFTDEIENLTKQAFLEDRLRFHFHSWSHSPSQSGSQNFDLKVTNSNNSVKGLLVVPRKSSYLTDQTKDSFERTFGSLSEIQVQVGANLLERFDCKYGASQPYMEVQKLLDFEMGGTINPTNWSTYLGGSGKAFLIGVNLSVINDDQFLSGYSGRGDILVKLIHASTLSEDISYYNYVLHDVVILCGAQEGTRRLT